MQTVLTIAGFDPSSGAGVTADLMVFAAHGLYGTACITALTVQSTLGVRTTHATPDEIVEETLACLNVDIPPAGIKIGMIANADNTFRISCLHFNLPGQILCDYQLKIPLTTKYQRGTLRESFVLCGRKVSLEISRRGSAPYVGS